MSNSSYLLIIISFFLSFSALSQLNFESRLEIDLKEDDFSGHKSYLFGEDGFVIRSVEMGWSRRNRKIKYQSYNNNLQFNKDVVIEVDSKKSNIYDVFSTEKHIVELVYDLSGKLMLTVLEGRTLNVNNLSFEAPKGIRAIKAHFAGDYIVVVMNSKKAFSVFTANVTKGSSHIQNITIPNVKPGFMTVESISSMDNSNESIICIDVIDKSKKNSGKRTNTYLAIVDCDRGINKVVDINSKISNTLLTVSGSRNKDGNYVLTGTYTTKLKSEMAEGLFISEIENERVKFVEYNGFSQFEEFLKYLPERTQGRIEKKKEKKEKAGKEVTFSMRAIHHPLVSNDDAYFILAEYFYPTYRTVTRTLNGQTTTYTEFDGYRYTHASLVKYDLEGKMQWDRTFELTPSYKPFYPIRFITMAKKEKNESITMVFCSRNRIVSKGIRYSGGIEYEKVSEEIETGIEGDKTKRSFSDVDFWYDNFFLVHGFETIKNTTGDTKRKRHVYFVSKLKF